MRLMNSVATEADRIFVGFVFVIAGILKIIHWGYFESIIGEYRVLSFGIHGVYARIAAIGIVGAEIFTGGAVALRLGYPWTGLLALVLLTVFSGVVAAMIWSGKPASPCGCMILGKSEVISRHLLFRNGALSLLLLPGVTESRVAVASAITLFLAVIGIISVKTDAGRLTAAAPTMAMNAPGPPKSTGSCCG